MDGLMALVGFRVVLLQMSQGRGRGLLAYPRRRRKTSSWMLLRRRRPDDVAGRSSLPPQFLLHCYFRILVSPDDSLDLRRPRLAAVVGDT